MIVVKLLGTGWTVYDKCTILLDNRCHVADLYLLFFSSKTQCMHCIVNTSYITKKIIIIDILPIHRYNSIIMYCL